MRWGQANIDAQLRAIMRRFKLRSVPSEHDGAPGASGTSGAMVAYAKRNSTAVPAAPGTPGASEEDGEARRLKSDAVSTPPRARPVSEAGSSLAAAAPGIAAGLGPQTSLLPPLRSALTAGDGKPRGGNVASGSGGGEATAVTSSPLIRKLTFRGGP